MIEAMFVALTINTTAQLYPFNQPRLALVHYAPSPSAVGLDLTIPRFTTPLSAPPPEPIYWTADGASSLEGRVTSEPRKRTIVNARVIRTRKGVPTLE